MKNLSLNTKLFMIILTEVIISTIILTSQSVKTIQNMSHQNVIQYETQVIDAKKEALKNYVDMAKGILQIYRDKVTKDTTPQELENIKKDAIKAMDSMVYGDDNGYVFVWSYDGVPLAFNPRPDLIGKKLLHLKGGEGRMVIEDHIANAKKGGGHFYTYKWKTTKDSPYQTKISYSFGVQEWGWFVGTGEYLSKEEKEIEQKRAQLKTNTDKLIFTIMMTASILILATSTILYFLVRKIVTRPLESLQFELSDFFLFLQNKKDSISFDNTYSNDEIGQMSKEINDNIQVSVELHKDLKQSEEKAKVLNETLEEKVKLKTYELKDNLNFMNLLVDSVIFGVVQSEMGGRCINANNATLEMMLYKNKNDLIGKSIFDVIADDSKEIVKYNILNNFEEPYEINLLNSKNEKLPILMKGKNIIHNGQKIRLSTFVDISELKKKDKLLFEQSKLASMGDMIGNIAHQWRQPLSVISTGATGMLLQKEYNILSDEEFKDTCNAINNNAQYLSKTIDDFRNFIKGDRTQKVFNLKDGIGAFLQLVEGSIKNHQINMVLDLEEGIEIDGYENELTQCFINIFNNAKDALKEKVSNEENKLIFIKTSTYKDKIVITIKDNAGGIPNDIIDKIFEPYFTTKHQSQGTGLGLHMTYSLIVDGMGGTIEVSNIEYKYEEKGYVGAQFVITLPV